jgi:hypothetical protein
VVVEGIDPMTGRLLWSWDAGNLPSLWDSGQKKLRMANEEIAIPRPDATWIVLNARTGRVRDATKTDVAWCERDNLFASNTPLSRGDTPGTLQRKGQDLHDACYLIGGAPATTTPGYTFRFMQPPTHDGYYAWGASDGLHGDRMPTQRSA